MNDFRQWMIDKGKAKRELTNIMVNDNGSIKTEQKMAWVIKSSPENWREFCKDTKREYTGEIKLLIY